MRGTIAERFWAKVRKTTDGCWLWQGAKSRNGYGYFAVSHKNIVAVHRVSWQLAHGQTPDGLQVLHRCDVPTCVNPAHLFLGTQQDNVRDMIAKGRAPHVNMAAISDDAVRIIRVRYASGETQTRIAQDYGVHQTTISAIVIGRTRRNVL